MFTPTCLLEGCAIDAPAEDFRAAKRVEQYRVSAKAIYIPAGLRWTYLPLSEIRRAEESHRAVSAGKCVSVTERRPTLAVTTDTGEFKLNLERVENMQKLLDAIHAAE